MKIDRKCLVRRRLSVSFEMQILNNKRVKRHKVLLCVGHKYLYKLSLLGEKHFWHTFL